MSNKDTNNMKETDMEELDAVSGGARKAYGFAIKKQTDPCDIPSSFSPKDASLSNNQICGNCNHLEYFEQGTIGYSCNVPR